MQEAVQVGKSKKKASAGWGPWPAILGGVVLGLVGFMIWTLVNSPNSKPPPKGPWETFPSEGRDHLAPGTEQAYKTDPPTSGPHWGTVAKIQFYNVTDQLPPDEQLVHNLEHGNIIIYYDPQKVSADVLKIIQGYIDRWHGPWDGVLAIPRQDDEYPIIMTAWTHMLKMKEFNQQDAEAFIDAFRGRGPENPVR